MTLQDLRAIALVLTAATALAVLAPCGSGNVASSPSAVGVTSATLVWSAPATRVDGTPLYDLAGFKVTCANVSGTVFRTFDAGLATSLTVTGLPAGLYRVSLSAYDTSLRESDPSNTMDVTFR